jgi:uncharacterized protein
VNVTLHGESLQLLPERALFWPRENALIVADVHLGKDDVFRARGIPVPRGSMDDTFARLTQALKRAENAQKIPMPQLIVLGDFLHAKESVNAHTLDAFNRWRAHHPTPKIIVVEGNHDRHAGTQRIAQQLGIDFVAEPFSIAPFVFRHEAHADSGLESAYELSGHVHPCTVLSSRVDRLRVPCFVLGECAGILPAFGAFTGGHVVSRSEKEAIYAIAGERIIKVPTAQTGFAP